MHNHLIVLVIVFRSCLVHVHCHTHYLVIHVVFSRKSSRVHPIICRFFPLLELLLPVRINLVYRIRMMAALRTWRHKNTGYTSPRARATNARRLLPQPNPILANIACPNFFPRFGVFVDDYGTFMGVQVVSGEVGGHGSR